MRQLGCNLHKKSCCKCGTLNTVKVTCPELMSHLNLSHLGNFIIVYSTVRFTLNKDPYLWWKNCFFRTFIVLLMSKLKNSGNISNSNSPPQCWLMSCWDPPERCNSFRLAPQSLKTNHITACWRRAWPHSPSTPRTSGGCTRWCRSQSGGGSTAPASCGGSGYRGIMKYAFRDVETLTLM